VVPHVASHTMKLVTILARLSIPQEAVGAVEAVVVVLVFATISKRVIAHGLTVVSLTKRPLMTRTLHAEATMAPHEELATLSRMASVVVAPLAVLRMMVPTTA